MAQAVTAPETIPLNDSCVAFPNRQRGFSECSSDSDSDELETDLDLDGVGTTSDDESLYGATPDQSEAELQPRLPLALYPTRHSLDVDITDATESEVEYMELYGERRSEINGEDRVTEEGSDGIPMELCTDDDEVSSASIIKP